MGFFDRDMRIYDLNGDGELDFVEEALAWDDITSDPAEIDIFDDDDWDDE